MLALLSIRRDTIDVLRCDVCVLRELVGLLQKHVHALAKCNEPAEDADKVGAADAETRSGAVAVVRRLQKRC